jgi:hypothetical protein
MIISMFIELDDGKIYRKALYLMVKTMVSCRFSLKPIHWYVGFGFALLTFWFFLGVTTVTTVGQSVSQPASQSVSQWIIQPCSQFIRSILLSFILSGFHFSHFMWFSPFPFPNFSFPSLFVISFHFLWFHVLPSFGFTQPFIPSCHFASLFYSFRNFRPTGK